jgi:hypothetical protein
MLKFPKFVVHEYRWIFVIRCPPPLHGVLPVKEHEDKYDHSCHKQDDNRRENRENRESIGYSIKWHIISQVLGCEPNLHGREHDGNVDNGCQDPGEVPFYKGRILMITVLIATDQDFEICCLSAKSIYHI